MKFPKFLARYHLRSLLLKNKIILQHLYLGANRLLLWCVRSLRYSVRFVRNYQSTITAGIVFVVLCLMFSSDTERKEYSDTHSMYPNDLGLKTRILNKGDIKGKMSSWSLTDNEVIPPFSIQINGTIDAKDPTQSIYLLISGEHKRYYLYKNSEYELDDWYINQGTWEVEACLGHDYSSQSSAGTVLSGDYPENAATRLASPSFQIPIQKPRLRFWHWYNFASGNFNSVSDYSSSTWNSNVWHSNDGSNTIDGITYLSLTDTRNIIEHSDIILLPIIMPPKPSQQVAIPKWLVVLFYTLSIFLLVLTVFILRKTLIAIPTFHPPKQKQGFSATLNEAIRMIKLAELEQALTRLETVLEERNQEILNQILLLQFQLHEVEREYSLSVISYEENSRVKNKIAWSTLELISQIRSQAIAA